MNGRLTMWIPCSIRGTAALAAPLVAVMLLAGCSAGTPFGQVRAEPCDHVITELKDLGVYVEQALPSDLADDDPDAVKVAVDRAQAAIDRATPVIADRIGEMADGDVRTAADEAVDATLDYLDALRAAVEDPANADVDGQRAAEAAHVDGITRLQATCGPE